MKNLLILLSIFIISCSKPESVNPCSGLLTQLTEAETELIQAKDLLSQYHCANGNYKCINLRLKYMDQVSVAQSKYDKIKKKIKDNNC